MFVVSDGTVRSVAVKRGISDDVYVEIVEGLQGGEEVVSGPFRAINRELEEGSKVKVDNERTRRTGGSVAVGNWSKRDS